ncbi:hypothetical protein RV08_GL001029 [Enterococcus mundtii]|nr:hypothetical protein RV08_GL001029 [Enterococcus mundtii]
MEYVNKRLKYSLLNVINSIVFSFIDYSEQIIPLKIYQVIRYIYQLINF